jgi:gliding motility-associated-like protein
MRKLLLFLAFTSVMIGYSQAGYLDVDAGTDVTGNCGQSQNLTATYNELKETTTYVVASLPYAPPTDFTTGTVPTGLTSDDQWSDVVDLGFSFCYFGNTYTQITIGSNAQISFNTAYNSVSNHWDLSDSGVPITLPQPNDDSDLAFNTIYGPGHDINPATCGDIVYEVIGIAPFRSFVVKYTDMCHFSCGTLKTTSMIVVHETTNNIDVYIKEKPVCSAWNDGYAVIGINNADGTTAVVPPGRNTSVWNVDTSSSEAWRFTPDGASVTSFEWTDSSGAVLGTTPAITVTPFMTTIYTATAEYTSCNGDIITMSDTVEASTSLDGPLVDLGADAVLCDSASMTLDATPSNAASFATITYLWSTGETTATITATSSGTYSVTVSVDGGCMATDEIVLGFGVTPQVAFLDAPYNLCHAVMPATNDPITITPSFGTQDTTTFTYEWFALGSTIPVATTAALSVAEPGTYTLTVTGGSCSSTETVLVSYYNNEFCTYPEGISPNGDQMNERFDLEWLNDIEGIKNLKFFNRHGTLVYEKDNYSNEFVGKSDNDYELPTGTYFYVLTLANDTVKNGYLYINR